MFAASLRRCLLVLVLAAGVCLPAASQMSPGAPPPPNVAQVPSFMMAQQGGVQRQQRIRVTPPAAMPPATPPTTSAPLPAGPLGGQLQKADALRGEGSFRLAREQYNQILAPEAKADPETRTHAQVFELDCAWRERAGDGMARAQKDLPRLVEDLPADSRWRAEAAESLGDLLNEQGRWMGKHESLEYWLIALKYWGGSPDVDAARPRYVALGFKIAENAMNRYGGVVAYPATAEIQALGLLPPPPPGDKPWQGDLASWALRNVLRVTSDTIHRTHAMLMLGEERMNYRPQNWGPLNTRADRALAARWEKEAEDYLKQAAAITPVNPFTDRALWDLAQYYEQRQRYVDAARTVTELLRRFSKSETQYYDAAQEMNKRLTRPQAAVSTGEVYNPDSYIRVQLDYRNINRATLRILKINPDLYIEAQKLNDGDAMFRVLSGEKVRELALEGITDEKKFIPHNKVTFLEPLPAGLYVAEADAPGQAEPGQPRRCVFRVSRLALTGRNAGENDQAFAADAETGKPLTGVKITALYKFQRGNEIRWETRRAQTDASGVAGLARPVPPPDFYPQQVLYYAAQGGQFASAQNWGGWNTRRGQSNPEENLVIYTTSDRPAYRPGEPILWKAILRASDGKTYKLPAREKVYVVVRDGRNQTATEGEYTLSEFGSINGSFTLDRKAALGMMNLEVWTRQNDKVLARAALARLEEYKLPEYKVSVEAPTTQTQFGAAQTFNIGAEFYSGGPVPNAAVEVVVYRKAFWPSWRPPHPYPWYYANDEQWGRKSWIPWHWPGYEPENIVLNTNLKTDAQGKAKVELAALSPDDIKQAQDRGIWGYEYRVEARVVDASRREVRETGSVKTARQAFAAYLTPRCYLYLPGDPVKIDLKTLDPNNRPVAAEGFVTMYKHTWNDKHVNDQGRVQPDYDDTRLVVRPGYTAKDGGGLVEFSPSEPGCYLFRFETRDQFGAEVKSETIVFVAGNDTRSVGFRSGGVMIVTDKDTYQRGETAHVLLSVRRQGAAVWFGVESEGVNSLRVVPIEGTVKMIDVPVTADMEPNVFFTAAAMFDYEAFQDRTRIVVPPTKQFLDVKLTSPKPVYKPGEKAKIEVEIKDADGKPVATEIALGAADAAVWAIQGDLAEDIRQAFWSHLRELALFNLAASPGQQQTQRWRPKEDNPEEFVQGIENEEQDGKVGVQDASGFTTYYDREDFARTRGIRRAGIGGGGAGGFFAEEELSLAEKPMNGPMGRMELTRSLSAMPPAAAGARMSMMKSLADKDGLAREDNFVMAKAKLPGAPMQEARVRSNFSSTAVWLPAIVTDADGHASTEVTFPDSLTTWKLTARAADKATRVGQIRTEVKTNKPVLVRPEGPRFFTQGDAVTLSAIVNNNTSDTLPVEVSLDLTGLRLTRFEARETASGAGAETVSTEPVPSNEAKIRILVPGQGQRRVDWRAVAETPGTAKIKTTALTTVDSDAVERTFPVFEYGIEQFIAAGATIKGTSGTQEKTMILNVPEARRPGSEGLTIWIEPTLARTMVSALDYLAQYPYGCVEQTMSRFVPAVITAKTLQQLGLHKPELEKTLPDMIKAGLDRLEDFQHADGGWGWWKEGASDLYMTAYVVQGLAQALAADAPVKRETLNRAVGYLTENLVKAQDQVDLSAFMLYALASANPAPPNSMTAANSLALMGTPPPVQAAYDRVWTAREKLNPYTRALFTMACRLSGRFEWSTTLARNMRNALIEDKGNGTAHWGQSGIFYHWSDGGVESTAFGLRALLAAEPGSDVIDPAMTWLVRNRKGSRWENTKDTAITISALADYIKAVKEDKPDWTAEVEVNGEVVATLRAEPGKVFEFEGKVEVPASKLRTGENKIVIRRKGSGVLYASAWLTYFTREAEIKAAGNEVFAERKYFHTTLKPTLSGNYTTVREEVKPGTVLKSGDRIDVELNIEAKNNYEYVVIEDLKAAGMEPTEVQSGDVWGGSLGAHRELRDEKTAFFVTRLPEGKHLLKYELRAEVPGVFSALPTLVHAMYVPEIRANSASARVEIRD